MWLHVRSSRLVPMCVSMALLTFARAWSAPADDDPFRDCHRHFEETPQDYEAAYCFYAVAQRKHIWDQGRRELTSLMRSHPDNYWLPLALGHIHREVQPEQAEASYRRSADGFRSVHHAAGEIQARGSLRTFLMPRGRVEEASREMSRVAEIADSLDDPLLEAQVWTMQASHVQDTRGDLGLAYRLLKQAERAVFPDGPYRQQRTTLTWLGLVAFRLGRHDEAVTLFERLDTLARANGDAPTQAVALFNLLNSLSLKETLLPTPGARQRLLPLAERTLVAAAAQHRQVVAKTHRTIAALLANEPARRPEALRHLDDCLALAAALQPQDEMMCAWLQASLLQAADPGRARAAHLRALAAAERANDPLANAYSAGRHMHFSWQVKPRAEAIRDSLAAIDAIETLRRLQDDERSSAELFRTWTLEYYWLSGRLLQGPQSDLDLAFSITERMRARSLLAVVERSRAQPDRDVPATADRREILKEIAALQRTLMNPELPAARRRDRLASLEALELREREAQRQIALASRHGRRDESRFATLRDVQSALADDEAILSFQVGIWETYEGDFGGGAWLMSATRQSRSVVRIPDRSHFAHAVPVFVGLLSRRDRLAAAAAFRLYQEVFAGALERLPQRIRRLIVIADGPLQRLPFDALRAAPEAAPLARRFELVNAPSATLWLHWRTRASPPATGRVLAFADPETSGSDPAATRIAPLHEGLRAGPLPYARREGRALVRHIGAADVLTGRNASERALKERDLRPYHLLHFAAHAVSDERFPERSAVLLSPGSEGEDGLLQAREIQELDLDGKIVVLSACQTATGAALDGEGVLSLARAFFEAGARAVIGTRWPIRDAGAAALFETFYRGMGGGLSLSEALTRAKVDAMAAGVAADTWASLELLGDGAAAPFQRRSAPYRPPLPLLASLAAALLSCGAFIAARRRRALGDTERTAHFAFLSALRGSRQRERSYR
jgi:CHAT domain-containing protein